MTNPSLDDLPRRVDFPRAAELVTHFFFPVSARSLESWHLSKLKVNGRNVVEVAELFAKAQARLDAAVRAQRQK